MARARTPLILVGLAASHCALGLYLGLFDGGDYSLLTLAVPFVVATLLAAAASAVPHPVGHWTAVALTGLTVLASLMGVGLYLIGLFHLPQSVAATVVAARS